MIPSKNPRLLRVLATAMLIAVATPLVQAAAFPTPVPEAAAAAEQYGVWELTLKGPSEGNPFVDVRFSAVFTHAERKVEVTGFYDGDGMYKVRFMPELRGEWKWETRSNRWPLTGRNGVFTVGAPAKGNHGPVRVRDTYHFGHADGSAFRQVGTTCYSWHHRPAEMEEATLKTLAQAPFNKLRMCVFPQDHNAEKSPPSHYPYAGTPPRDWDFSRFNPAFFRHLEKRVADLGRLGVQADLILFHPYGKTNGFDTMDAASDERYIRYLVARLGAFHNVWWSVANEYDFIRTKTEEDMDRVFKVLCEADPYNHLRSIHNGFTLYDNRKPWVTHASIQNGAAVEDVRVAQLYRDVWRKPVVFDEVKYEGDSTARWGQLSGREMVHRFWCGTVAGNYVGHSECLNNAEKQVWLGEGIALRGESPARLAFLRKVMEEGPAAGIEPVDKWQAPYMGGRPGEYYLLYFGHDKPTEWTFKLHKGAVTDGQTYTIDILDTWEMTVTPVEGVFTTRKLDNYHFVDAAGRAVKLPGREGIALRIRRSDTSAPAVVAPPPTE